MPVLLDNIIDPEITKQLTVSSFTSEDEDVVVVADLNVPESWGWLITFLRRGVLPSLS